MQRDTDKGVMWRMGRLEWYVYQQRNPKCCKKLQKPGRGKEGCSPRGFRGSMVLLMTWFQTSSLQNCERVSFCSKPPDLRLYFGKLHLGAEDSTYHWSDTVILLVAHEGNIILASLLSFLQTLSSFSDSVSTPPSLCGHSMSQRWFPEQLLSRGTTQQTREVRGSELSGRRGRAPPSKWDENMAKKGWINVPSIWLLQGILSPRFQRNPGPSGNMPAQASPLSSSHFHPNLRLPSWDLTV